MVRIRRSAQIPGDMWIWFVWEVLVGWAIPAVAIVFLTDWPLPIKIGAVALLLPVAVLVVLALTRFMGE
jgi:hypothetical protein